MTAVALTGANGFLGWHTRCAARAYDQDTIPIPLGEYFSREQASAAVNAATRFVHIAGVNRGTDDDVREGNIVLATQAASALEQASSPPSVVVFANSIQVDNGSVYGESKREAAAIFQAAAERTGAEFVDVVLPNLFGEHARPFYNSVVATFCHLLATGGQPHARTGAEVSLLHAQDAAEVLLGVATRHVAPHRLTVATLLETLTRMASAWREGYVPELESPPEYELFRTLFSSMAAVEPTLPLHVHSDDRGTLIELARHQRSPGQVTYSTTVAGKSRADHFHRRKVERLIPVAGRAIVSLRRLFTSDVQSFELDSRNPTAIDIPAGWAHRIHNPGPGDLGLAYWSDSVFNPDHPDTTAEPV